MRQGCDEEALFDDDLMNEYRAIQEEMVDVFMPLVKLIVKAGLLTMQGNCIKIWHGFWF